jgi:flagellar hook-associated protein 3 FlgL
MRISFQTSYRNSLVDINQSLEDLTRAQRQVSSGKRLELASDDPAAAAGAVTEHGEVGTLDQYLRSADTAGSRLSALDTVLGDIVSQLTQAQAVATGGLGTSATQATRDSIANELQGIKDALLSDFTTTFHGTYLLSGTNQTVAPYARNPDGTISAYAGNTQAMRIDVDRHTALQVTYDGSAVAQGSAGQSVFDTIDDLITNIRAGLTPAVQTGLDELKAAFDRAVLAQTRVGNDEAALEDQKTRLGELRRASLRRLSAHEDVNMAEAVSNASAADTAHKAALAAVSQIANISLLDYLE